MYNIINKSLIICAMIHFQKKEDFGTYRKNECHDDNIGSNKNSFFEMGSSWVRKK